MLTHNSKKRMLVIKSNNIITFLSITSILFIFLFSIIYNDILITVQSSIENTTQTTTNNSSNQSDPNSNSSTAVQWKKFVNETVGISFEYPSNWEENLFLDHYFDFEPTFEAFPSGEYPWGTHFAFLSGKSPYNNLEVLTRVLAVYILDHSGDNTDYEIIEKPNMEKYKIDGGEVGAFSYKEIHHFDGLDAIFNVELINSLKDGKFFIFKFMYPPNLYNINEKNMTQLKDHIINSIKLLHTETNVENENIPSLDEQLEIVLMIK